MKTFKQLQESITKALKSFGGKGIRKVQPNVEIDGVGRFNPDMDLKQFNRTQDLKRKYQNVDTPYKKGLMMKQKMVGVQRGVDPMDTVSSLKKEPVLNRLARQGKPDMLDANVNLQRKYADRTLDRMQGFKPTESGPNTEGESKLSTGKGEKARKRAVELLKSRIKN
tara:strand:- start:74 stop:574 length:501 start_codon:yes stop_codon:yes gene_type:complete